VKLTREIIAKLMVRKERMAEAARDGFMNATDLADYLVGRGVSFREAHGIAGSVVAHCLRARRRIEDLALAELKRFSRKIDADIYEYLSVEAVVERRIATGGTAKKNVLRRLKELRIG
jgi:argininosuccinate lyase